MTIKSPDPPPDDVLYLSARQVASRRDASAARRHGRDTHTDPAARAKVMYDGALIRAADQTCCAHEGCRQPFQSATPHGRCSPRYDHIHPISAGGAHAAYNLQILCHRCNHRKSASVPGTRSWVMWDTAMTLEPHPCAGPDGCSCPPRRARHIAPPWPLCETCGECPVWTHDPARKTCSTCHRQGAMTCDGADCGGHGIKPKSWWSQCRMCYSVARARERIDATAAATLGLAMGARVLA